MKQVLIHCKPEYLSQIKELGLYYIHSPNGEIDVTVPDIDYEYDHVCIDPDRQLCYENDIDYDQVNCIEAVS